MVSSHNCCSLSILDFQLAHKLTSSRVIWHTPASCQVVEMTLTTPEVMVSPMHLTSYPSANCTDHVIQLELSSLDWPYSVLTTWKSINFAIIRASHSAVFVGIIVICKLEVSVVDSSSESSGHDISTVWALENYIAMTNNPNNEWKIPDIMKLNPENTSEITAVSCQSGSDSHLQIAMVHLTCVGSPNLLNSQHSGELPNSFTFLHSAWLPSFTGHVKTLISFPSIRIHAVALTRNLQNLRITIIKKTERNWPKNLLWVELSVRFDHQVTTQPPHAQASSPIKRVTDLGLRKVWHEKQDVDTRGYLQESSSILFADLNQRHNRIHCNWKSTSDHPWIRVRLQMWPVQRSEHMGICSSNHNEYRTSAATPNGRSFHIDSYCQHC